MVTIKIFQVCDECQCANLQLEYRELTITDEKVVVVDYWYCGHCRRHIRTPLDRVLEDAAIAIEGA